MSSALLLYRLHCVFPGKLSHTSKDIDTYKRVWKLAFTHKPSGIQAIFSEHKGAGFLHPSEFVADLDPFEKEFENDVLEFVNLLFSPAPIRMMGFWQAASHE